MFLQAKDTPPKMSDTASILSRLNLSLKMKQSKNEIAILGGGCFWCTEAIFKRLKGVKSVIPGYAGGQTKNPSYKKVSSQTSGHAEVVKITFDSKKISYDDLLEVFWHTHDPTTKDRQGHDVGNQYRSIILYTDLEQRKKAEKKKQKHFLTEILPLKEFYEAEEEHHNYFERHQGAAYCQTVISPKIKQLEQKFTDKLK